MHRSAYTTLALLALCSPSVALEQPAEVPNEWKLGPQTLPPIAAVLNNGFDGRIYGIYTWAKEYLTFRAQIKDVGFNAMRLSGPIDDEVFIALAEDGIEVMLTTLNGNSMQEFRQHKRSHYASDEDFIAAYVAVIEARLKRYGPNGSLWREHPDLVCPLAAFEVWNEPNFHYMIPDSADRAADEAKREALYPQLLKAAYETVKRLEPDLPVVGFSAGGASAADRRWFANISQKTPEAFASCDIVSTHPYTQGVGPEVERIKSWGTYSPANTLAGIRAVLPQPKPIWYTEVGWSIDQASGGQFPPGKQVDRLVNQELQAAYVVRLFAYAMRLDVPRVHIMTSADADGFNGGFFDRTTGAWRMQAQAVKAMRLRMPKPRLHAVVHDGEQGLHAYAFRSDSSDANNALVTMCWHVVGARTLTLPAQASDQVFDMLGNPLPLSFRDGKAELSIGPYPIYLVHTATR